MKDRALKTSECPNCHSELQGENYCPNCGQKNDKRRLSFGHFVGETLSNFLAFDGRVFFTLRHLFRYPGRVPAEFKAGKRMRYMNPVRIYFLSSLLMLFIIQYQKDPVKMVRSTEDASVAATDTIVNTADTNNNDSLQVVTDQEVLAPLTLDLSERAADSVADDTLAAATKKSEVVPGLADSKPEDEDNFWQRVKVIKDHYEKQPQLSRGETLSELGYDDSAWNHFLYTQAVKIVNFDEDEFNQYLLSKLFWVLFLFIPLQALLLKLFYIRRDFYYPEHLFFCFYNQAVFFLLASLALLIPVDGVPILTAIGIFMIYFYLAMLRFYKQGAFKTFLKFFLFNSLASVVFSLFFLLSIMVVFIIQ